MTEILGSPDAPGHLSALQQEFGFKGFIKESEHRGITFSQLKQVFDFLKRHCEKWYDLRGGQPLSLPAVNLHNTNDWVIKPSTRDRSCAFVELLAQKDQVPNWFVSHWWGEIVADFLRCVESHHQLRFPPPADGSAAGGEECGVYWICAYANRQHSLVQEVTADPRETSFYKALGLAKGVLLILDEAGPATPFTRIWCMFEESVAFVPRYLPGEARSSRLLFDVAATRGGFATVLTDGLTAADELEAYPSSARVRRERQFPAEIFRAGLNASVEEAEASEEADRVHILNCIVGRDLEARPVLEEHREYGRFNTRLHATFAVKAWRVALLNGLDGDMHLAEVLKADQERKSLELDFNGIDGMNDTALRYLADALPRNLQVLELGLQNSSLTGDGLKLLMDSMPGVRDLTLNLAHSTIFALGDGTLEVLAHNLPKGLQKLSIDFGGLNISKFDIEGLVSKLPRTLSALNLNLQNCANVGADVVELVRSVLPEATQRLELGIGGIEGIVSPLLSPLDAGCCSSCSGSSCARCCGRVAQSCSGVCFCFHKEGSEREHEARRGCFS